MAEYKGLSGKQYHTPDAPFAGGGEGDIYDVTGAPDYVAKIYRPDKRTTERERKLSFMTANRPGAMEQYAWPLDVLYENGSFAGYLMPKIKGKEKLRNLYVYDKRKGKPWPLYVAIAKNLSAAVYNVHEIHQVIGDLNPENILVNPNDGMVVLVDTDSYHISDSGRTYRCGVGMPEFVAPELQGIHFPSAPLPTFTPETDRFSLAVLIFALLMNGAHPFACTVISGSSSRFQPIDNMQNGKCAFFPESRAGNMEIPRYAPDIKTLPETHLKTCRSDPSHIYYEGAAECPWCQVSRKMSLVSQTAYRHSGQGSFGGQTNKAGQSGIGGHAGRFRQSGYAGGSGVRQGGAVSSYSVGGNKPGKSRRKWRIVVVVSLLALTILGIVSDLTSKDRKDAQTNAPVESSGMAGMQEGSSGQNEQEEAGYADRTIPAIEPLEVFAQPIESASVSAGEAEILFYSGTISSQDQVDRYSFQAAYGGTCRIEAGGLADGMIVKLFLYDSGGNEIKFNTYCTNGSGITVLDLTPGESYEVRVERHSGYGTYSLMIGLPGQTVEDLVQDIRTFQTIDADMIGMGPYLLSKGADMVDCGMMAHDPLLRLSLNMIAATRLVLRDVNIAAATALETLEPNGRILGIMSGCNVVMPNITPQATRSSYQLYDNKSGTEVGAESNTKIESDIVRIAGRRLGLNQLGSSIHWQSRR